MQELHEWKLKAMIILDLVEYNYYDKTTYKIL